MTDSQTAGWHALLEVHERLPDHWTLVGGQMVHLLCAERGAAPPRPTDDLDAVLDVRADGRILHRFTSALVELGFTSAGTSPAGHQHRWTRAGAQIDVLIPRHVGERAATRRGAHGGTTLGTPAAQQALDRSASVEVVVDGVAGRVRRPNLLGALVAKAAAHTVVLDPARGRHRADFAVLTTLIAPPTGSRRPDRGTVATSPPCSRRSRTTDGPCSGWTAPRLAWTRCRRSSVRRERHARATGIRATGSPNPSPRPVAATTLDGVRVTDSSLDSFAAAVASAADVVDPGALSSAAAQVEAALAGSVTAPAMRSLSTALGDHAQRWLDDLKGWGDDAHAASDAYATGDAGTRSRFQAIAR